jgi:hypothetical protein
MSPPNQVRRPRPHQETRPAEGPTTDTPSVPSTADIAAACQAYAVLLLTPAGKYRRRVFLSLHSATAAVQRAQDKGQRAHLVLCRLVPVAPDLDLGGEWSA